MAITEQKQLEFLLKQYDAFKDHRKRNYERRFIENYKLYKSYRDDKISDWQSNVFLSYVFTTIETVLPRLVEYLFRGDRFVTAFPRERNDESQAKVIDFLMQYQIDTQIENLFLEWTEKLKQCLIYGTSISKLTWNTDEDKPQFSSLDIFDFVPQPYKKYISEMDGVYHVYDKFVDYLLERKKMGIEYKNLNQIMKEKMSARDEEAKKMKEEQVGKSVNYDSIRPSTLIYEYWGKVPVQDSIDVDAGYTSVQYQEEMVMIANRKYIIRMTDNPYKSVYQPKGFKPFIAAKNYPDPSEFYALGDVDSIRDIQHMANELENQSLDNLKLLMNKMWKVGSTAGVDYETLISYPGGVVIADQIEEVQPLPQQDLPASFFKKREDLMQDLQRITGVTDYSRGANAEGMSDTATGITSLIEEANMRFSLKIKIIQNTAVREFAEHLFRLDQLFIKDMQLPVRIQGDEAIEWMRINPDNLRGMFDFKPIGVSMIGSKMARQNTLLKVLGVLSQAPPIPPLIDQILDEFEFKNKEEIMGYMQQMWGMAQQAQQLPPGMPPNDGSVPTEPGNPQVRENLVRALSQGLR